jgi:hypothetical protein
LLAARVLPAIFMCLACSVAATAAPARRPLVKPDHVRLDDRHERHVVSVKFRDDLTVRLREAGLTDLGTGALRAAEPTLRELAGGQWLRAYPVDETRLATMRSAAERRLGRGVADLNTRYHFLLPPGADAAEVIDRLNRLACVELASPCPRPVPPPVPPDYQPSQAYENAAPLGIGAESVWDVDGITGAGVRIIDLEYGWNLDHGDLPEITRVGFPPVNPFFDDHHGTAVLGQLFGVSNGWGVTGIAHDAEGLVAGVYNGFVWNVGGAVATATAALEAGDVILIEQQTAGPNGGERYVPVEWLPSVYDAILVAVGNGIVVVEAAGNGGEDLDAPEFTTGNGGHWPFLPEHDSGAIIVGAGSAPGGSSLDRSRLSFSSYGSTVDLQGWGEDVWTTGYGDAYASEGADHYYTSSFGGTSSASPIVAGACALVQSAHRAVTGLPMSPQDLKTLLQETGSPQTAGAFPLSQNIGPRPDAAAAVAAVTTTCDPETDCNGNGSDDACDLASGASQDCNANGVPDECDLADAASEDCNANGAPDECETNGIFGAASPTFAPLGVNIVHVWELETPPPALGDVTLHLTASGDLGEVYEVVRLELNGVSIGSTLGAGALDCEDSEGDLVIDAATYNLAIAGGGDAVWTVEGGGAVDPAGCGGGSYVEMAVSYPFAPPNDTNRNGVPDDCEASCRADLDGGGAVGFADLAQLLAAWGACAQCPEDLDGDGAVGFSDLSDLLASWGACPS